MRIERFKDWLVKELENAEGVKAVRSYQVPEVENPVVDYDDGTEVYFTIVATSSDTHKDDRAKPEVIVERDPESAIVVINRPSS